MTDSMKFGPEWLRNMSSDNTHIGLLSAGGNLATNSTSSCIGGSHNAFAPRNTFPEFRYGREEMLSLFDKNYSLPEILPKFKKIFVERVQLPLALTPTTDEELLNQLPTIQTQRPPWMQRSPVGFTSSTRGTGRGGSVDRGRLRGKLNYHQVYQRPSATFDEDDLRSVPLKIDRGWNERNGIGDALSTSGGNMCGFGVQSDWNGTPNSSPRKEYASQPRSLENWRRNRIDDGSGDTSTSIAVNADGWRGSNSAGCTFNGNQRWGRSTSWREEDSQPVNAPDAGNSNGIAMQRSYSTITTANDRVSMGSGSGSGINKTPSNIYGSGINQASIRTFGSIPTLNAPQVRKSPWNVNNTAGTESDDILPEWAMENPSNAGGTFDASGAFHGCIEGNDNSNIISQCSKSSSVSSEDSNAGDSTETPTENLSNIGTSKLSPDENSVESSATSIPRQFGICAAFLGNPISDNIKSNKPMSQLNERSILDASSLEVGSMPIVNSCNTMCYNTVTDAFTKGATSSTVTNIQRDLSDRMQEVADDMIEKLIMDDDTISVSHNDVQKERKLEKPSPTISVSSPSGNHLSALASVSTILKHSQNPDIPASAAISLTATPVDDSVNKDMHIYSGDIDTEQATTQHHLLKQQHIATTNSSGIGINSTISAAASTDLWYYKDPQFKVQGPFTATEMAEWYRAGYFNGNLYVRRLCDTHFRSLGDLIKLCNDNMPFTHSHLIPNLENMHLPNDTLGTLKQIQKGEQCEQLKENTNLLTSFLNSNGKNRMVPTDASNIYYHLLRHQEILIYNELSANECFQQLTPSEKDAVLQQRLQMRTDYLPTLAVLSNSITAINSSVVANEFYSLMEDGSRTDSIFHRNVNAVGNTHQQPRSTAYIDTDNFRLNSQPQQQPLPLAFSGSPFALLPPREANNARIQLNHTSDIHNTNEILNNFGMPMCMSASGNNLAAKPPDFIAAPSDDFLNEGESLVAKNSLSQNNYLVNSWLPPVGNLSLPSSSEWANNMLVGISMPVTSNGNCEGVHVGPSSKNNQQSLAIPEKLIPTPLWDVPTLDNDEQIKPQAQFDTSVVNFQKKSPSMETISKFNDQTYSLFDDSCLQPKESDVSATEGQVPKTIDSLPQNSPNVFSQTTLNLHNQSNDDSNCSLQNVDTKHITRHHLGTIKNTKELDEVLIVKKNDEVQRQGQVEDKRRQKEDKKRQQSEEEKRRQTDEDKRRQVFEEKEKNPQTQAQRRKAVPGSNNMHSNNLPACLIGGTTSSSKPTKDQRIQSSIAPWSSQTNANAKKGGPCLAEIQRAERRERQLEQRQIDTLVKRMRAGAAAAAEAFDSMLKWNAPIQEVPVKSFVDIQAEEAKRLANEHNDIHRRKEQQQVVAVIGASGNTGSNLCSILSGTKVWGSTNPTGFWEEPVNFSTAGAANTAAKVTDVQVNTSTITNNFNSDYKQITVGQHKSTSPIVAVTATGPNTHQLSNSASRNLRKSQTVSIMQTSGQQNGKNTKSNQQHNNTTVTKQGNRTQLKSSGNVNTGAWADKRGTSKGQHNNLHSGTSNKRDDYENEFNVWCTKSLNNMNTKLDVPTFVTFLRDLESPYEVKDYIRMYLGDNKESTDFGKQFLERRSIYKNLQRAQNAHNDDMCKPAPAITPSGNDSYDYKGKQKKVKKNKMTKLDARILGFSVTAAEGRTNVGDRVYVDAP